jgi:hypothetical protein
MSWPVLPDGVDPGDYREVSFGEVVFPPGDPLVQLSELPSLPPGTITYARTEGASELRVEPEELA